MTSHALTRLGTLAVLVMAALSSSCQRISAVEQGARNGIVHIGNRSEPEDLDPQINISAYNGRIFGALFEGLVRLDPDGLTARPGAAERWEISADGLTYTFHLRNTATWSNGDPLRAEDFRDGLLRLCDPALACEGASFFWPVVDARDYSTGKNPDPGSVGVAAPNATTLIIRLEHPTAWFLAALASPFCSPAHRPSLDRYDGWHRRGAGWTKPGALVTNGPFRLKAWIPAQDLTVEADPRYWDAVNLKVRELHFHPIEDLATQERAYRGGQLHLAAGVPLNKVPTYQQLAPRQLEIVPTPRTFFVTFNVRSPPFDDARVRRSLSLAIDRDQLVAATQGPLAVPATALSRPGLGGYNAPTRTGFDPAEAKRLMTAAGYPGGSGFPMIEFTLSSTDSTTVTMGEVIQSGWKKILGIDVTLRPVEHKTYLAVSRTRQFQLLFNNWGATVNDPVDMYQLAVTGNPNNDSQWTNAAYDREFQVANETPEPEARHAAFDRMEALLAAESPHAPLYYVQGAWLVHPTAQPAIFNANGSFEAKQFVLTPGR